ncbi:HupE/UreJ family protein [Haloferula chungangensis]|uniref:HupE/UreJ family protein n=1 Tax=Haloferula chungangensis TaxID=1048331 RepID=A0ABW2L4N4_9BACT
MIRRLTLLVIALFSLVGTLVAHEMQPAYLELKETPEGSIDVTWKVPYYKGRLLPIHPIFPDAWQNLNEPTATPLGNATLSRWRVNPGDTPIDGAKVTIEGPRSQLTDILLRAQLSDGRSQISVLRPEAPYVTILFDQEEKALLWDYIIIGVEHIIFGYDHLLFVLCLVLIVRDRWTLVKTITAFTLAHSVTLGIATLGWMEIPGPPVEAVIALSILFLARELLVRTDENPGLTERYPWLVALSFGLLHGFGFAGALSEVGLPEDQIPLALLNFNIGVELGQLAFVAVIIALTALTRKITPKINEAAFKPVVYATGIMAAFWCVERISGFWS